ncbi:MAG: hypothetical protein OES38_06030 [Gammaproteobacteria bacterium]|nr:hypothetical protein [Gammaproteobacteria bacterium]
MRFLFGLLLGAVLTLFVATAFDAPTHALVDKGKASWQDFLLATGDALFEFPELTEGKPDDSAGDGTTIEAATPWRVAEPAPDTTIEMVPEVVPDMAPVSDGPDMEADTDVRLSVDEPRDLQELLAAGYPAEDTPGSAFATIAAIDGEVPVQSVWVPFRSQMSAQGFAKRLTGQLDHPFAVNREGPGRYQVSFNYESESQRLDVLGQVQSLTGQELP